MSHDTDKLIRQLSLVAFLMAERRALTARDVKSNVDGARLKPPRSSLVSVGVGVQRYDAENSFAVLSLKTGGITL